jgi:hypothetical protein
MEARGPIQPEAIGVPVTGDRQAALANSVLVWNLSQAAWTSSLNSQVALCSWSSTAIAAPGPIQSLWMTPSAPGL